MMEMTPFGVVAVIAEHYTDGERPEYDEALLDLTQTVLAETINIREENLKHGRETLKEILLQIKEKGTGPWSL